MCTKEIGWDGMVWIDRAQNRHYTSGRLLKHGNNPLGPIKFNFLYIR